MKSVHFCVLYRFVLVNGPIQFRIWFESLFISDDVSQLLLFLLFCFIVCFFLLFDANGLVLFNDFFVCIVIIRVFLWLWNLPYFVVVAAVMCMLFVQQYLAFILLFFFLGSSFSFTVCHLKSFCQSKNQKQTRSQKIQMK